MGESVTPFAQVLVYERACSGSVLTLPSAQTWAPLDIPMVSYYSPDRYSLHENSSEYVLWLDGVGEFCDMALSAS